MTIERDDEFDATLFDFLARGLSPVRPGASLRDRLLSIAGGNQRFLPFLDRMMALFDLPETAAQRELDSIDEPDAWDELVPGVQFRDFEGGPAIGDAHGGLVRVEPGSAFPLHEHVGEEHVLILQGEVTDDRGNRFTAGDTIVSQPGSVHEMRTVGDEPVIYAARVVAVNFVGDDDDDDE